MSLNLNRFTSGQTDYIDDHNENATDIENEVNRNASDIAAIKSALNAGADQDYRENVVNLAHNSNFEIWQRAARPDRWIITPSNATFSRDYLTTYYGANSLEVSSICEIAQSIISEQRNKLRGKHLTFGMYGKTDEFEVARLAITVNGVENYSSYFPTTDVWSLRYVSYYFADAPTSLSIKIVQEKAETVYYSGAMLMFGNPNAGPIYSYDYLKDHNNCRAFYEEGLVSLIGHGYRYSDSVRRMGAFVRFCEHKYAIPAVTIVDAPTGITTHVGDITQCGFQLLVDSSDSDGVYGENIEYTAEVTGY